MALSYKTLPTPDPRQTILTSTATEDSNSDSEIDHIYDHLQLNLSALSSDSRSSILTSLDWFEDSLSVIDLILPEHSLSRLLELITFPDLEIVRQSSHVISLLLSFPSVMNHFFIHNGLLDFIRGHFPDFGSIRLYRFLALHSDESRDALLNEGYLSEINSLFHTEKATKSEIISLSRSLVTLPLNFDPHGPSIFELFSRIADLPLTADLQVEVELAEAFVRLLRCNEAFIAAFIATDLIQRFLQSPAAISDYFLQFFAMLSLICNSDDAFVGYLIEFGVIELSASHITEDDPNVGAAAVELISDVFLRRPEMMDRPGALEIPEKVVDLFGSQSVANVKLACVHFAVVALALASERKYDELVHAGCGAVLLAGINLVQEDEIGWALRILLRGHRGENQGHAVRYRNQVRAHVDVIEWLEEVRACEKLEYAEMAAATLNILFPENPVELSHFE